VAVGPVSLTRESRPSRVAFSVLTVIDPETQRASVNSKAALGATGSLPVSHAGTAGSGSSGITSFFVTDRKTTSPRIAARKIALVAVVPSPSPPSVRG